MNHFRILSLLLSAILLSGTFCACAPKEEGSESSSSPSSQYAASSSSDDRSESSASLASSVPENVPTDLESRLLSEAEALTYQIVNLVFTRDHIENAQSIQDGDIFRFMLSLLVENQLVTFYPDCLSVGEDGQASFPLDPVQQMVRDVFGQSDWFFADPSYDEQKNAYFIDTGFGLSSVYSYEDLVLTWNADENTVTADFSLIDTPAFPGEQNYGTYRITYRAMADGERSFLRYEGVQKVAD